MTLDDLRLKHSAMIPAATKIDIDPRCIPLLDAFLTKMAALRDFDFEVVDDITTEEGEVTLGYAPPLRTPAVTLRFIHREMSLLGARSYYMTLSDGSTPRQVVSIIDDLLHEYDPETDDFFPSVWKGN